MEKGKVLAVSKSKTHTLNKYNCEQITLLQGLGVLDDAHLGSTVKHRYLVRKDPNQPNLRQVHLIHAELFSELATKGFVIKAGELGENITTSGIDLLKLPKDTILKIGNQVAIVVTGLRDPCKLLESIQKGLMKAVLEKDAHGNLIRKTGIMGIVQQGGNIRVGDEIKIIFPEKPYTALEIV